MKIDSMLKFKLRALKCFFNFLSTIIFHGVRISFVKNAGLVSKSLNSIKKIVEKLKKKAFCRQNVVVYEALLELFEKNSFVELQSVKNTKF